MIYQLPLFFPKITCAHLELKETKNIAHFFTVEGNPHKRYQCNFAL